MTVKETIDILHKIIAELSTHDLDSKCVFECTDNCGGCYPCDADEWHVENYTDGTVQISNL